MPDCPTLAAQAVQALVSAREAHVRTLVRVLAEAGPCYVEPALRLADGSLAVEGVPPTPYRVDLIAKQGMERIMIDSIPGQTPAIRQLSDGVELEIGPLVWDQTTIDAAGAGPEASEQVQEWFLRWFDPEDANPADAMGLQGVVHSMSDIRAGDGCITFTLDLGSAPARAVEDLVSVLVRLGATGIRIA